MASGAASGAAAGDKEAARGGEVPGRHARGLGEVRARRSSAGKAGVVHGGCRRSGTAVWAATAAGGTTGDRCDGARG